jgi:hypothetical protein
MATNTTLAVSPETERWRSCRNWHAVETGGPEAAAVDIAGGPWPRHILRHQYHSFVAKAIDLAVKPVDNRATQCSRFRAVVNCSADATGLLRALRRFPGVRTRSL